MGLMDGKVVLVTGSARGVGKAVAMEMAPSRRGDRRQ